MQQENVSLFHTMIWIWASNFDKKKDVVVIVGVIGVVIVKEIAILGISNNFGFIGLFKDLAQI